VISRWNFGVRMQMLKSVLMDNMFPENDIEILWSKYSDKMSDAEFNAAVERVIRNPTGDHIQMCLDDVIRMRVLPDSKCCYVGLVIKRNNKGKPIIYS